MLKKVFLGVAALVLAAISTSVIVYLGIFYSDNVNVGFPFAQFVRAGDVSYFVQSGVFANIFSHFIFWFLVLILIVRYRYRRSE